MHERTVESDFLALLCKDALIQDLQQPHRELPLRIVVMSATVEAALFRDYFQRPLGAAQRALVLVVAEAGFAGPIS